MIKIGLVGAGNWGKNHARILNYLSVQKKCDFVGIADVDIAKEIIANQYRVKFFRDYQILTQYVDAVIIALPPSLLTKTASFFLQNKKHALVEKPFALDTKKGKKMVYLANKNDLTLMGGYIFLFTPQITEIKKLLSRKLFGKILYS